MDSGRRSVKQEKRDSPELSVMPSAAGDFTRARMAGNRNKGQGTVRASWNYRSVVGS